MAPRWRPTTTRGRAPSRCSWTVTATRSCAAGGPTRTWWRGRRSYECTVPGFVRRTGHPVPERQARRGEGAGARRAPRESRDRRDRPLRDHGRIADALARRAQARGRGRDRGRPRAAQGRPGTGSNSTAEAIDLTRHAERVGAAGALIVNPYYNKPTQDGLYRHFRAVAEAVAIPILVYNIQSRTAVNVETATLERLVRDVRNVAGVKEASGSLDQMSQVIAACGPDFSVLSGDDNLTLPLLAIGGHGVISVIANILPRETADMVHAALEGDWKRARDLHYRLFPLARAAFLETNPIPIKEAMAMAGMIEPEFRLPMCRMSDANRERLRAILTQYALVK